MIEWLQNYSGINSNKAINSERAELQFLRKEMQKYGKTYKDADTHAATDDGTNSSDEEDDNDDEENDKFEEELRQRKLKNASKGQRSSVSAEAYGNFNKKKEFVPRIIDKNDEQKERILAIMAKSFLFNLLADKERNTVLLAFEEVKFNNGDVVIKQGDQGDILYLIETGYYECYKKFVRSIF